MPRPIPGSHVFVLAFALAAALGPVTPARADVSLEPIAEGLDFPTNLAFAPDGRLFFTEKENGRIRIVRGGRLLPQPFETLDVVDAGETGLLGITLHPAFPDEPWVYVYYSDAADERNRVVRLRADGNRSVDVEPVFEGLPAVNAYHNGGDIAFGPDGMLYAVTGEAHVPDLAQDPTSAGGKILRLAPDGSIPADNPFPGSPVFALGIRNSFGICFNPVTGDLWETENGPSSDDEVNKIEPGGNYGWPVQLGPGGGARFIDPQIVFPRVVVPTGCAFTVDGRSLYFGDYGGRLRRAPLAEPGLDRVATQQVVATAPAGIVDVARGPDGDLYVATTDAIYRVDAGGVAQQTSKTPASPAPAPVVEEPGDGSLLLWIVVGTALAAGAVAVASMAGRRKG